ncbi:MAG: ankyrin repeat domain-containing protein [Thiolinea sp.]
MHVFKIDQRITLSLVFILFCLVANPSAAATNLAAPPAIGQTQVEPPKTTLTQNYLLEQLQIATQAENAAAVKKLLAKGADPGRSGKLDAHSALTIALSMDQMPLAYSMLPYLRTESFNTQQRAIFYTARRGDLALLNALLALTDEQALEPHSPATRCEITEAIRYGHQAIVERLYAYRPDCQDQLLLSSIQYGQPEIFAWLLNRASTEQKQALQNESYMSLAIQNGNLSLIKALERLGNQYASAEQAVRAKQLAVLKYYVKTGKLKTTEENYKLVPIAAELDAVDILEYLKNIGIKPTQTTIKNEPICPPATHQAATAGAANALNWLLANQASSNDSCTGDTLIHAATQGHQAGMLAWLLSNKKSLKLDINAQNFEGDTALHRATRWKNLSLINILLKQGASRTAINQQGNTPLHEASQAIDDNDARAILTSLLDDTATDSGLNIKNANGDTTLLIALGQPNELNLRLFLEAGAKVNLTNNEGLTALHKLVNSSEIIPNAVDLLIAQGAEINRQDYSGKTPLFYALEHYQDDTSDPEANQNTNLEQLLAYQPEINLTAKDGTTPLHLAVKLGKMTAVKRLLDLGAKVQTADKQGNTSLHYAAVLPEGQDFINLLHAKGAELNALNNEGNSPIFLSANTDNFQALQQLGADLKILNKNNESVIAAFSSREDKTTGLELIKKAQSFGVDINVTDSYLQNALHRSIRFNSPTLSLELVKAKINLNQADSEGNTPLMLAVRNRSLYHVKLLIKQGANINLANHFGKTALQQSIELGEEELFNVLLAAKAEINTKDTDQRSPLLTALANNKADLAAKLIALGADVNIRSKGEWTALHYAAQLGNPDLVKVLLDAGAVNGIKNWGNKTPADLAKDKAQVLALLNAKLYTASYFQTTDKFANTPLHWAVREQNLAAIRTLLSTTTSINAPNHYGETALMLALKGIRHNPELATAITKQLLEAGADVNTVDQTGNAALYYALQNSAPLALIDALLAKHADLNKKNNYGTSLAAWLPRQNLAVLERLYTLQPTWLTEKQYADFLWPWVVNHPERELLTAWLLAHGVDPNKTSTQQTQLPMVLALRAHAYELLELLRKAGGHLQKQANDLSALNSLIQTGDLEASLELLKQTDYSVDFSKEPEMSQRWLKSLTESYGNESISLVKQLLALGLKPIDPEGKLMQAALSQDADLLIRVYHQAGLPLKSLMLTAAANNALRSLDYLQEAKISVNETDENQQTPLNLAIANRHIESVRWLVQQGVSTKKVVITAMTSANWDQQAELNFFKELKILLPQARPSYNLVYQLLKQHDYQATLALLDNWPDTIKGARAELDAQPETDKASYEYDARSLSALLIYYYNSDAEQAGLTVLKRLVAEGESLDFLRSQPFITDLGTQATSPELLKTLYELGYHYTDPVIAKRILQAAFETNDSKALETINFLLQQTDTAISPDIFNQLVWSSDQSKDNLINANMPAIYAALTQYFQATLQTNKLKQDYLINMLASTEFCSSHSESVLKQMEFSEFTSDFLKEQGKADYRALPCLAKPELLTALTNQAGFENTQFKELGFLALASNFTSLEQLKMDTATLIKLGADINTNSAAGDTVATAWLNLGLAANTNDKGSLNPDLILEGFRYLQSQGFKFTNGRNLTHELMTSDLISHQVQNILPLMDGLLGLQAELASLPDNNGQQTLHLVASNKSLGFDWQRRVMQRLLKEQVSLNASDALGNTPLLAALKVGNLAIADWLVEQGADIAHSNQAGETALHFALSQLTQVANNTSPNIGTVAQNASVNDIETYLPTLVERLLKKGAAVNSYDEAGNAPLHRVAMQPCRPSTPNLCQLQVKFAQALLAAKAEVDSSNADADTPLLLTAHSGNTELAKLLLEHKAAVNSTDKVGNQALSLALDYKHYGLADELIAQGADIQQANWAGLNPVQHIQDLKKFGLARVISHYHPEIIWDQEWLIAQQQPRYFYDLLVAKRLRAVAASDSSTQTQIYSDPASNNTLLHVAAQANAADFIVQLLKLQHPIDIINNQDETPLHLATITQSNQTVSSLLAAGANPLLKTAEQQDALMLAVISNNPSTVQTLLEHAQKTGKSLNLNQQDKQGKSLLHHALAANNLTLLEILLKAGVDPELADHQQRTALLYAVEQGNLTLVKALVEHKASLTARDAQQRTPLLYAIWYYVNEAQDTFKQHLAERIVLIDYLLAQGADLQAVDENQATVLHLGMPVYELGQHLLSKGADIHKLNKEGETAIFQVIAANYPERQVNAYLQVLLDKGLAINARNTYGETLLSKAVRHDKLQVMEYLLEHGADPTVAKDANPEQAGFTLPMYIVNRASSSTREKIKLLSLLKAKGADLNALNARGENTLFLAVQSNEPSYDLLNWLLSQGVSAQVLNQQEQSLLHLIIKNNLQLAGNKAAQQTIRQQLVATLIGQGLNLNARDMNGRSALHYALEGKQWDWVDPLLNAGINPNIQSNIEEYALSLALKLFNQPGTEAKDLSLIKKLLAHQADPNQRDSLGETCLFAAYRSKQPELIQLLLDHGANPAIRSYYGQVAGQN